MKRIFITLSAAACFLVACNNDSSTADKKEPAKEEETKEEKKEVDISANPDYQKGLAIVAKSDCLTCHKVDERVTGPSYREVAEKYAGMPDTIVTHLAKKVIHGGTGVWGQVPMIPHPALSQEEAEAAVKYVLLLKK